MKTKVSPSRIKSSSNGQSLVSDIQYISEQLKTDFKITSATYESVNNRITINVSAGTAIIGNNIVEKETVTTYYKTSPSVNTTYYVYVVNNGNLDVNTAYAESNDSMLIAKITVGSAFTNITVKDLRTLVSKSSSGASTDITSVQSDVTSLQSSLSTTQSNVTSLQSSLSTTQSNVTSLQSSVSSQTTQLNLLQDLTSCSITYTYTNGAITSETVYDKSTPPALIKSSAYTYDSNGNLTIEVTNYNGKIITKTITYDSSSNITSVDITVV